MAELPEGLRERTRYVRVQQGRGRHSGLDDLHVGELATEGLGGACIEFQEGLDLRDKVVHARPASRCFQRELRTEEAKVQRHQDTNDENAKKPVALLAYLAPQA